MGGMPLPVVIIAVFLSAESIVMEVPLVAFRQVPSIWFCRHRGSKDSGGMDYHILLSFGRILSQSDPFLVSEFSFLGLYSSIVVGVVRFEICGVSTGAHSLVSLVVTMIGTIGTAHVSVCVVSAKLCHDGCMRSIFGSYWEF